VDTTLAYPGSVRQSIVGYVVTCWRGCMLGYKTTAY